LYSPLHLPAFFFFLPEAPAHKTRKTRIKAPHRPSNRNNPKFSLHPYRQISRTAQIRDPSLLAIRSRKTSNLAQQPRSGHLRQIFRRCGPQELRRYLRTWRSLPAR
jgi:hypothetical protein